MGCDHVSLAGAPWCNYETAAVLSQSSCNSVTLAPRPARAAPSVRPSAHSHTAWSPFHQNRVKNCFFFRAKIGELSNGRSATAVTPTPILDGACVALRRRRSSYLFFLCFRVDGHSFPCETSAADIMATSEQAPPEDNPPASASASHPQHQPNKRASPSDNNTPKDQTVILPSEDSQKAQQSNVNRKRRKVSFGPVERIETQPQPGPQPSDDEEDDDYAPSDDEYADEECHGLPPEEFASAMAEISSLLKGRLKSFIDSGKLGSKPLHAAAAENDVEKLKQLLAPDGECNGYINDVDVFQYNALHVAAERGCVEACQLLIQCGIDKNATTSMHQSTALHYAAFEGHDDVIDVLLNAGISLDAVTDDGRTALYQAALRGHTECVELLLKNGANPLAKTKDDKTPLQVATNQQITELLEQPPPKKPRTAT